MEGKRITVIPKNPNPLFKKWLQEFIDEAEKKRKKSGKVYEKALDSLNKYPLTLFSGHDCAILENFGPKICQLLDEKLEIHLSERRELHRFQSYKDKVTEVQRQENILIADLIQSVEAACLIDNTESVLSIIDEESQDNVPIPVDSPVNDERDGERISQDVEIPEELLSSSAESEDSFDRLMRKYDPDAENKMKHEKLKRKKVETQDVIKRTKKLSQIKEDEVVDLSHSPSAPTRTTQLTYSPVSTVARSGVKLRKFKTFDSARRNVAGPSYASSPISKFLDVAMNSSQLSNCGEDEFDKLATKYDSPKYDFPSPIPVITKKPSTTKLARKPSNSKLKTIAENPPILATQNIPEEAEDEIAYVSVDDINPLDFIVILLIDIQETSG